MDKVRKETDKELEKLEKKIASIYKQSEKDIEKRWADYMNQSAVKISEYQKAYDLAVQSKDSGKIKEAKEELKNAKLEQTLYNNHYKEMIDSVTQKISKTNEIALSYLNDKMPKIYSMNHNAIAPTADSLGIDFTIVNEKAVRNMIKDGDIKLPYKHLDKVKDKRWNTKKLNSHVLQGIIGGESMEQIAKRILPVVDNNENSAIRNARTLVTGVENQGRLDSFDELKEMGTVIQKKWVATADENTRESHLLMDGETVELEEEFSNGLMYPADPDGDDESEIYNCRCTMESVIVGFMDENGNINYLDESLYDDTTHEKDIAEEIEKRDIEETVSETEQFIPAQTIEEAENYAKRFVEEGTWSGSGNVSYKGMSVDVANKVNETLANAFDKYNLPPLRNIEPMNLRKKIFKDAKDAPFCYRNAFSGDLFFNPNIIKTEKTIDAYMQKGREAFDYCAKNIDKFSGSQKEMVETYIKAGRSVISDSCDDPLKAMIDHEMGHHIQHQIVSENKDYIETVKEGFDKYGVKISGYATSTKGEYIAESFSAYNNGYEDLIDPKMKQMFKEMGE